MTEPAALEQFYSKKNHVCRSRGEHQDVVIKRFTDESRFLMEKEIGDLLQNSALLTPVRLSLDTSSHTIVYAYIDSSPVVDLIEETEFSRAEDIIKKICTWLVHFYALMLKAKGCQYILGDIHMRNFLYEEASHKVYGIDFEECRPGRIETDAARLYAFILNYAPAFTPRKKALAACFWETLSSALTLDEVFFKQEIKRETAELLARRAKKVFDNN